MKLLLDTRTLLWWWAEPDRLSPQALGLLRDPANQVFVSTASTLEISIKIRIDKFPSGKQIIETWDQRMDEDGFNEMPMNAQHALRAGIMPGDHSNPFDRILAAQSLIENIPLLSSNQTLTAFGATLIW